MASHDLPAPDHARNMRLIGYSDQGGRPDGVQLMVASRLRLSSATCSPRAFRVIDVRDPRNPKPVTYVPAPPNTWNIHLQTHGDLLLVINAKDMFAAAEFQDEHAYYKGSLGKTVGTAAAQAGPPRSVTGRRAWRSTTSPTRRARARSASCRSRAAACTASGTPAVAGPTSRRCSTASPTTSS